MSGLGELPCDMAAERAVLGLLISMPAQRDAAQAAGLTEAAFHALAHRHVWRALLRLPLEAVCLSSLVEELSRDGNLEVAGGRAGVAALTEAACSPTNLPAEVGALLKLQRARALRATTQSLMDRQQRGDDALEVATAGAAELAALADAGRGGATQQKDRFAAAAIDGVAFAESDIPRPRALLGAGLLVAGGLAIIYGKPGIGKTWHALELSKSIARGEPWLGTPTAAEGARVAFMELELDGYTLQQRARALGVGTRERDRNLVVVARPLLRGAVDLFAGRGDVEALRELIRAHGLQVLAIDALSRAHTAPENDSQQFGQVLITLDSLRHDTGCAIVLLHHERKGQPGDRTDDLDALRGTSRLQSDPTLLIRLKQLPNGLRCLVFAKVSGDRTPEPIYFRLSTDGLPEVVAAPASAADAKREQVRAWVSGQPERWVTAGDVEAGTGVSKKTCAKHLRHLADAGELETRKGAKNADQYRLASGNGEHRGTQPAFPIQPEGFL